MRLLSTRDDLLEARRGLPAGTAVAAVLTMGALHEGHRALVAEARRRVGPSGTVVLTVFVNPLQFAAGEDLSRYPRSLDADVAVAEQVGVDVVFAPSVDQMYPDGSATVTVDPGRLGDVLEGAARPTHFRGVLTVVAMLLNMIRPSITVFGEKDYQQLVLVRRMCRDLAMGVEVVGLATVREPDGLARSSRNVYLSSDQRAAAVVLSQALSAGQAAAVDGATAALEAASTVLVRRPEVEVDYLVVTDPELGEAPETGSGRMLVAARLGATRLIDNAPVHLGAM